MLNLGCKIQLKKPCHVGFRQAGRQVLDDRGSPYIPSLVLRTQIFKEALRFAQEVKINPPSCSDALIPQKEKAKIFKIKGKEYFKANLYFELKVEEKDISVYLAALKSLQNVGFGGNTSQGFGYNKLSVVKSDLDFDLLESKNRAVSIFSPEKDFPPLHFVKLESSVFGNIKRNWKGWAIAYDPGPFKVRYYYRIEPSKPLTRGSLRSFLVKRSGIEHRGRQPVCSPKEKPCLVCDLLGCLNHKSRLIFRPFPKAFFLIAENLREDEKDLLEKTLGEEGYKFSLEEKEVLKDYLE